MPLGVSLAWTYPAQEMVWDVATTDLEGDGHLEVIAASYDKHVYALDNDGELVWLYRTGAPLHSLDVGDLDGDGRSEVVVGGDDNQVHALAPDGSSLWAWRTGSRVTSLRVGTAQDYGRGAVLAGCWDGGLWLLNSRGELVWHRRGADGVSRVELADIDDDGRPEAVIGDRGGAVTLIEAGGVARWTYPADSGVRKLLVVDVDGDGRKEVIVASIDGWLHVLDETGVLQWKRPLGEPLIGLDVADVDGDGIGEMAVSTGPRAPKILLMDHDGEPRWDYSLEKAVWVVALADVDGDSTAEVVTGGDDGTIRILDIHGRLRGGYQTARRVHGLDVVDLTADGVTDIVARSGTSVYVLVVDPSEPPWKAPEASGEVVTLPEWAGPIPGLASGEEDLLELVAVGDIMLSRTVEERTEVCGSTYPFEGVAELLRGADITIGNLECPLSLVGDPIDKRYLFRAHPQNAEALTWAGVDAVNLANNHVLDFGQEGFEQTLEALESAGVAYLGAGPTSVEAHSPWIVEAKGKRIAFLAYAASRWEGSPELPTKEQVSFADLARIAEDVEQASHLADLVVAIMHLGTEYQFDADDEQLAVSRAAIDAGACLVIGHHSHVVQGTEVYGDGFIAYGLGNFVFDIDAVEAAREGAVLRVLLGEDGVQVADLIPVRIVDDVQPRLLAGEGGLPVVRRLIGDHTDSGD
jgi:poly-gamma-glutamate synthesis protein (capsule biosynthesis protein)